ncbi:hypothetical protein [Candidatus Poriferisocius sp.]|uniref:hypothetical protein n=1 Tax=Candidatus Poriferisocius sp. TaxID=3101276 RepID=UPI003B518BC2
MPGPLLLAGIGAGIGALGGFFGSKDKNQVTDADNAYIRNMRGMASGFANDIANHPGQFFLGPDQRSVAEQAQAFMNPYQKQVIDGLGTQYDKLRGQANLDQNAGATSAGAFGGSRHALTAGARLGELDAAQMQQTGNLLHQGWQSSVSQGLQYSEYQRALRERQAQEPLYRAQAATGLMQQGMGPVGLPGSQNPWVSGILGGISGGMSAYNAAQGSPWSMPQAPANPGTFRAPTSNLGWQSQPPPPSPTGTMHLPRPNWGMSA